MEEGAGRCSPLWCGGRGESADEQWECEAVVLLQGIAAVSNQSSGGETPGSQEETPRT